MDESRLWESARYFNARVLANQAEYINATDFDEILVHCYPNTSATSALNRRLDESHALDPVLDGREIQILRYRSALDFGPDGAESLAIKICE